MTDNIESIRGVGPEIAANLRDAGFESAADVRAADVDELAAVELIGESTAEAILNDEIDGRRGREPRVEEVIDDVRPHLEKPISDRAAIAQAPIGRATHKEWLQKDGDPYESYQAMYEEARAQAEEQLILQGLNKGYDSSLVKFLLKATFGYNDEQSINVRGKVDTDSLTEEEKAQLDAAFDRNPQ